MTRLYVFDMDGTLLPETTASLEIAKVLGKEAELKSIEDAFRQGTINTEKFADAIYKLWAIPPKEAVKRAFVNANKLEGIAEVLGHIKSKGQVSCLITLSPNYFADFFAAYGFDHIYASQFPENGNFEHDQRKILCAADKVSITQQLCRRYHIDWNAVVAFGDSSSDLDLFHVVGNSIAMNAADELRRVSSKVYSGNSLREAYQLIS
jgi:phosphoserine phosphatase